MNESVLGLIRMASRLCASDLHLSVGFAPMVRVNGSLERLDGREALSPEEVSLALGYNGQESDIMVC